MRDGNALDRESVVGSVAKAGVLATDNLESRGWIMDVLNCVNAIPADSFSLDEIYRFEMLLSQKHPKNKHVRDKIRQQLQLLRDKGYIEFVGSGLYRKANWCVMHR